MNSRGAARYLASNILHLIVMPTEQCNLRCTYCYEDFQLGRMAPSVLGGLKRFLDRRADSLDLLMISWFGGEPLLADDIVEEVQSHVMDLRSQRPRLRLAGAMTTNGYLLDQPMLARLLALEVRDFQVSLDGPPEWHDRKRVKAGGQGTFERIWRNLEAARGTNGDFRLIVRVHLDRENQDAIPSLLQMYRRAFAKDPRFELLLLPLARMGGRLDRTLAVFNRAEAVREAAVAMQRAHRMGLQLHSEDRAEEVCYAAAANSFLVRADGTLGKCTVALSHPENHVGRLLEDGTLELDQEKMMSWTRGLWSGSAEELECPKRGYADSLPHATTQALLGVRSHNRQSRSPCTDFRGRAGPTPAASQAEPNRPRG